MIAKIVEFEKNSGYCYSFHMGNIKNVESVLRSNLTTNDLINISIHNYLDDCEYFFQASGFN